MYQQRINADFRDSCEQRGFYGPRAYRVIALATWSSLVIVFKKYSLIALVALPSVTRISVIAL